MTEQELRFSGRTRRPDRLKLGAVIGGSLAVLVATVVTMAASPSPSGSGAGASAAPDASAQSSGAPDRPGEGRGGPFGDRLFDVDLPFDSDEFDGPAIDRGGGIRFGAITITAIDGTKVSLRTEDGWTRTIEVGSDTTITKAGQAIGLGDLAVGDRIRLREARAADGSFTIEAIRVVVPTISGTVTAVDAATITIRERDGSMRTISTTGTTTYHLGRATGSRADVTVGTRILAQGAQGSGDSFTATAVVIAPDRAVGTVTAKTASTITIKQRDGTSISVAVDGDTRFLVPGATDPGLDDIDVGTVVAVAGRRADDGSIDASVIATNPLRRALRDRLGHRGPVGPAPSASPNGTSNSG